MSVLEIRKYQAEARDAVVSQWDSDDPSLCNINKASLTIGRIFKEQGYKGNSYSKQPTSKRKKGYNFYK